MAASHALPEEFIVYLARHATPDHSRADIPYTLPPGPELTVRGRSEAVELGAYLRQVGVKQVQASPFERTLRTAAIACEPAGLSPEINPDLTEWHTTEPEVEVAERIQRAFAQAARISCARSEPVMLVTHGGPVMALLKALGLPLAVVERCRIYDSRNLVPPAGVWRVEKLDGELRMDPVFAPQGVPTLEGIR